MIKEECNYNYRCKDDRCLFACLISRGKGECKHISRCKDGRCLYVCFISLASHYKLSSKLLYQRVGHLLDVRIHWQQEKHAKISLAAGKAHKRPYSDLLQAQQEGTFVISGLPAAGALNYRVLGLPTCWWCERVAPRSAR